MNDKLKSYSTNSQHGKRNSFVGIVVVVLSTTLHLLLTSVAVVDIRLPRLWRGVRRAPVISSGKGQVPTVVAVVLAMRRYSSRFRRCKQN
jgi:hypothetical protein